MTASITVDVSEVVKKLDPAELEKALEIALGEGAKHIRNEARRYPPQSHKPMQWKSAKQRRWFFANLREGNIEVPYRRGQSPGSEKLGSSWNIRTENRGGNIKAIIGTPASYAPYVMDERRQAAYHKGNWKTIQSIAKDQANTVKRFVEQSLERWARR